MNDFQNDLKNWYILDNKFRDLYLIHRELDIKNRHNKSLEEILLSND